MSAAAIGLVVAAFVFAGGVLGTQLHRFLSPEHMSKESRDVVMLGTGMLSVLASLVLGLLIATAKSAYNSKDTSVRTFAADMILLDETLRDYGDDALEARRALRDYATKLLHDVWPDKPASPYIIESEQGFKSLQRAWEEIRVLKATNEDQRRLVDAALAMSTTLLRQRWLLIEQSGPSVHVTVIAILVAWIIAIFVSFGMNAPRNPTVYAALLICALAMGSAIFLILELDRPFEGLLRISADLSPAQSPISCRRVVRLRRGGPHEREAATFSTLPALSACSLS